MNRKNTLITLAAMALIAGATSAAPMYQKTVGLGGSELITLRGSSQESVDQRVETLHTRLNWILADPTLQPADIRIRLSGKDQAIYAKDRLLLTVTTQDAAYNQTTPEKQAIAWRDRLAQVLPSLKASARPPSGG